MPFQFDSDSQQKVSQSLPKRKSDRKFTYLVLGAFALLAVSLFAWHPLTAAARAALARRNAREAQEATSAKDWVRAYRAVTLARQRAPEDGEVLMAMVALLQATGADPAGLAQTLQVLQKQRPLTEEEELTLGRALIASGRTKDAREAYEKLPQQHVTRQAGLELLSSILSAEGHTKEAAEISRRAATAAQVTATPETHLQSAVTDLGSHFNEVRNQALTQLWQLAELSTATGLDAIAQLAASPALTLPQAGRLLSLEEKHPLKTLTTRLQVVSAMLRLQPERRTELAQAELQLFLKTKSGSREEIAYWLMRENFNDLVFALVPKDLAMQSRELYPILMQAMAQSERWEELQSLLKLQRPPVAASLVDLAMAEVQSHLQPDMRESRRLLEGTVANAAQAGDVGTLNAAAQLAEKLNLADLSCVAYKSAGLHAAESNASDAALKNLQKSVELALRAKDTNTLLEASRWLHELSPSSTAFADRFTYLRLMLGVELETVDLTPPPAQTEQNASLNLTVERMPPQLLQALSAYRLGDRETMEKQLAALPRAESLPPGPRAVAAGLLSLVGKRDRAFQIAEKISDKLLLAEEKVFLMRAL